MNKIINSFLRKEGGRKGPLWTNGKKLFYEDTCIAQWENHHIILNNTIYSIKDMDDAITDTVYQVEKSWIPYVKCTKIINPGIGDLIKYKS